jgi:uncharacterized protein with PIN domain
VNLRSKLTQLERRTEAAADDCPECRRRVWLVEREDEIPPESLRSRCGTCGKVYNGPILIVDLP